MNSTYIQRCQPFLRSGMPSRRCHSSSQAVWPFQSLFGKEHKTLSKLLCTYVHMYVCKLLNDSNCVYVCMHATYLTCLQTLTYSSIAPGDNVYFACEVHWQVRGALYVCLILDSCDHHVNHRYNICKNLFADCRRMKCIIHIH